MWDLADAVVWKFQANCEGSVEEGERLMRELLEHLHLEFKYEQLFKMFEEATEVAKAEKAAVYHNARIFEDRLRSIRQAGDSN